MATALVPVQSQERIWIMDALRGFAILGIFIANLGAFTFYSDENTGPYFSSFDGPMSFMHTMFIEGKFYSIFSFLFGWGIALQLQRSEAKGISSVKFVRRRLFIMFLLGLAHIILLWPGDIVMFYALVGFVLLWIRKWSDKTLLITAIILLLSPILLYFLKMKFEWANAPANFLFDTALKVDGKLNNIKSEEEFYTAIHTANFFENIKLNIVGLFFRYNDLFFQSRISKVLGMFILGYLMVRNGRYKKILADTNLLWTIALSFLIIGLPASFLLTGLHDQPGYYEITPHGLKQTTAYAFSVPTLAIAYISLFFLITKSSFGKKLMLALQPVGKMAFTNYIMHSVIGILFFTGVGFGLDRQVGPTYYTLFALIVFIFQIILSKIWLGYFEYGPVEWLWRSATYGKQQAFRKQKEASKL